MEPRDKGMQQRQVTFFACNCGDLEASKRDGREDARGRGATSPQTHSQPQRLHPLHATAPTPDPSCRQKGTFYISSTLVFLPPPWRDSIFTTL